MVMKINRDNYETYFLDYTEGTLSGEQEEMLFRFLKFNPDLEEELNAFSISALPPDQIEYPGREGLKKEFPGPGVQVSEANFEMYCVAYLENDLGPTERKNLETFLEANPEKRTGFRTFQSTKLIREEISYPHKEKLIKERSRKLVPGVWISVAAAAAILLMIFFGPVVNEPTPEIAAVADPVEEKKEGEENSGQQEARKTVSPTLNVIRKTSNPVPESTYKKPVNSIVEEENDTENKSSNEDKPVRIAGVQLKGALHSDPFDQPYDRLRPVPIAPPSINRGSLSALELARHQARRATEMIGDEEVTIVTLANSGLKELNRITGTDAQIMASRDEDGAISGIRFKSRILNFTAPISRDE